MYLKDYQRRANRTLLDKPNRALTEEETMIIWNAMGLAGEAGEVVDGLKKAIFHERGIDKDEIKKELGDTLWYILALCKNLDITLEEVANANIKKLEIRYPSKFTPKDSLERRDLKN